MLEAPGIHRLDGHVLPVPAATALDVGGIDGVPSFAFAGVPAARPDEPSAALDATHAAQGRALHDALQATTAGDAVAAVGRFLGARDAWRKQAPPGTAATEQQLEWIEGTARYADVLLALYPDPDAPDAVDPSAWTDLLALVRDPAAIPTGTRDRYAALGAAQAFLLDRLHPSWKRLAIPGGASLESLLRDVANLGAIDGARPFFPEGEVEGCIALRP